MPTQLYRIGGNGPALLLIHGFGADRLGWLATAPTLQERYSVWAVELPSHGAAEPGESTFAEIMQSVAGAISEIQGQLHLCGHSFGATIAAQLRAQEPDRFGKSVLIAPACLGGGPPDASFLREFPEMQTEDEAYALLCRLVHRQRLIQPAMVQHVLTHLKKPGRRAALKAIAETILGITAVPLPDDALVISGARDGILPPETSLLEERGALGLLVPDAGHLPHVEAAQRVNHAILGYLV